MKNRKSKIQAIAITIQEKARKRLRRLSRKRLRRVERMVRWPTRKIGRTATTTEHCRMICPSL
jgi:DNA anti-recombination protein RmuC